MIRSPISLLPILAKIFENIIFTSIFEYFIENYLFAICQYGFLSRDSYTSWLLSIIYKAFFRPNLDYADNIYDKPVNESFKDWLGKIRCNAALAVTDGIGGTSQDRIYNELGLESPADRRWYRRMAFFFNIVKSTAPKYLQSYLLPQALDEYSTRSAKKNLPTPLPSRTLSFSNTFFPYCINEWNKLNNKNSNSKI